MRCRSFRNYGEILRKNMQIDPFSVDNGPRIHRVRKFLINYKNGTIKEVLDSDKKEDKISTSP